MVRCKICSHPKLRNLVDALHNAGYTYRQIKQFLKEKYDIHISLGTLSHHFTHIRVEKLEKLPTLREKEVILTPEDIEAIEWNVVVRYFMSLEPKELENVLNKLKRIRNGVTEYPLTTNLTLYLELREIMKHVYPKALQDLKTLYIKELERLNISTEPLLETETTNEHTTEIQQ